MRKIEPVVNIIGAGLAGLSAAHTLAKAGVRSRLVSVQPSERAQSNLAEGGINACLNLMGENDTVQEHFADTMKGGVFLADPNMVKRLTESAPGIIWYFNALGVPFNHEDGHIIQRNFGGQKKKRTAYAKSSTGKVLMAALTDAVRKEEARGIVERMSHHRFERLIIKEGECAGAQVFDVYNKKSFILPGIVIMACGGFNGMFAGRTTGTTANTGSAAAMLFSQGVTFANLEFLQYHPTTTSITGKRLLISEAARGEGGRLFCKTSADCEEGMGEELSGRCYFMEEKFGPGGNLMPRDVISREMAKLNRQTYLDLTGLSDEIWNNRLSDLREEIIHYLAADPAKEPLPVSPGIHFCMGGILVDMYHRSRINHLLAAGECAAAYHGANRLGGNSLLGAVYGGRTAAETAIRETEDYNTEVQESDIVPVSVITEHEKPLDEKMTEELLEGMGILRDARSMEKMYEKIMSADCKNCSDELKTRILFAGAMLKCAVSRKESRGAHTRLDCPETLESFRKTTVVYYDGNDITVTYEPIPELE